VNVFDASALLAYLRGEEGSDDVENALLEGGACSTANWSEVAQKVRSFGRQWEPAAALLNSYAVRLEPVSVADAERAAALWRRGSGLSLGDRLCLSLGERLGATVWTADRSWGSDTPVRQIR
jgi:PIN domain nuclease of toxin-antitoxin system